MVQLSTEKDERVLQSLKVLNLLVLAIFELVATISQKFFPGRRLHNMHHDMAVPNRTKDFYTGDDAVFLIAPSIPDVMSTSISTSQGE